MNTNMISSGWKYYSHITPNKIDKNVKDPLSKAFETFLEDLLLPEEQISTIREQNKKLIINTNETNNNINIQYEQNKFQSQNYVFYKNRFLENKRFRQRLIDYYNSYGIYVKGPIEIIKKDGQSTNQWFIELSRIYKNYQIDEPKKDNTPNNTSDNTSDNTPNNTSNNNIQQTS